MSTLEGKRVKNTYKDLLQVSNGNIGVDGTLRAVEDGEGTVSALEISTTDVKVKNLTVTGTVTGLPSSATNLSTTANGTSLTVNSDTGTNASIPAATTSAWGAMTDEDKTKLNGIDTGATANDTDANLKNRANHTGTQAASTISDFDTEVANNTAVQANTAKVGITTAQANAIVANTAKVGITTAQANAIVANTAKVSNATHTGDVTGATALTLASVNSNVGNFTSANITVDAKGRITAASNGSSTVADGSITASKISTSDTKFNIDETTGHVGLGIAHNSDQRLACNGTAIFTNPNSGGGAIYIKNTGTTKSAVVALITNQPGLYSQLNLDLNATAGFFQIGHNGGDQAALRFSNSNSGNVNNATGAFFPKNNGFMELGLPSLKFDDIWVEAVNSGSDKNIKQDIEELDEAEKKVATQAKGLIRKYRLVKSVELKGESARTHIGVIAQDLEAEFIKEGLDPYKYGILGKDTWWEKEDEMGGMDIKKEETEGYTKVTRMSVRYQELFAFIISAL
jgi:hypothetical protein